MRKIELAGRRFKRLLVLREAGRRSREVTWLCQCDCGTQFEARSYNLRSGQTTSCGCWSRGNLADLTRTHGDRRSPEYNSWAKMMARCKSPADASYPNYGGRGITVCDRWRDYAAFLEDMGRRPTAKHSIERRDNDGNYEPANCHWATPTEQNRNRRNTRRVMYQGQLIGVGDLAEMLGVPRGTVYMRYKRANWAPDAWGAPE